MTTQTTLRAMRRARGLSAGDLAALVSVGRTSIHRWERRERLPGPQHIHSLAAALGAPAQHVTEFFDAARTPGVQTGVRAPGLRAVRRVRGLSAARLGELVGVPAHTVYNWESGQARVPDERVPALATALGMDVDRFRAAVRRPVPPPAPAPRAPLALLRVRHGLSQVRAAEELGVARSTLRSWEEGAPPPLASLRALAHLYDVPVSRVADAVGVRFPRELDPATWRPGDLPAVLRALREWSGLTQRELALRCGGRPSTVRAWESGRCRPGAAFRERLESLYRLEPGRLVRAAGDVGRP